MSHQQHPNREMRKHFTSILKGERGREGLKYIVHSDTLSLFLSLSCSLFLSFSRFLLFFEEGKGRGNARRREIEIEREKKSERVKGVGARTRGLQSERGRGRFRDFVPNWWNSSHQVGERLTR